MDPPRRATVQANPRPVAGSRKPRSRLLLGRPVLEGGYYDVAFTQFQSEEAVQHLRQNMATNLSSIEQ